MNNCSATLFTEDDNNEYVWHAEGVISQSVPERRLGLSPDHWSPAEPAQLEDCEIRLIAVVPLYAPYPTMVSEPLYYHLVHAPQPTPDAIESALFEDITHCIYD